MNIFFPDWLTQRGKRLIDDLQQGRLSIPLPEAALAGVISRIDEPTVSDLELRIASGARLVFSGRKRLGPWWLPFSATFIAQPPAAGAPAQAIDLQLEHTSPTLAYPFALKALAKREEFHVEGSRVRVDIGRRINQQDWARYLPTSILSRIRVVEITSDEVSRQLIVALAVRG